MSSLQGTKNCWANFIVISFIPILFFVSMVLGYVGIFPINVPIHALVVIGFILFVFLFFVKHNANYSICKMRANYSVMKEDLQVKLVSNSLEINDETKSILILKDYLNEYYTGIRNDNFAAVASSVFPMLGILGTFLAIAISMPNFSVSDTKTLDHEISILLSGIGSAFFASIYGILLSLVWIYFEKRGLSKVDKYFALIHKEFRLKIWTKDQLETYKYHIYELKDNRFISALRETFNLNFIQNLNEQHIANFKVIMDETNKHYSEISSNLQNVTAELKATLSQMDNSKSALDARNEIDNALVEFTNAAVTLEKTTKVFSAQLNTSLSRAFDKIDTEISNIVVKLADFATHVSVESQEVQDSILRYHQEVSLQTKR